MEPTPLEALHLSIIKSIENDTLAKDYPGFVQRCRKLNVSTYTLNVLISTIKGNLSTEYLDDPGTIDKIYNNYKEKTPQPEEETLHDENGDEPKSRKLKIIIGLAVVIAIIIAIALIPGLINP